MENNETQTQNPFISLWKEHLDEARLQISDSQPLWSVGQKKKINGLVMEAKGLKMLRRNDKCPNMMLWW